MKCNALSEFNDFKVKREKFGKILWFSLLLFICIFPITAKSGLYFGLLYPVPESAAMRNEYKVGIPYVFPEVGMIFKLNDFFDLSADISYRYYTMKNDYGKSIYNIASTTKVNSMTEEVVIVNNVDQLPGNDLTIHIIPVTISATHFFARQRKFIPYLSFGFADYSAFMLKKMTKIAEDGRVLGTYNKFEFQNGVGIVFDAGVNTRIAKEHFIGIALRYDYTFLGTAKNGGLENVGGLNFKLRYFINL